ncbi:MAG TPA: 2-dehydropantoate 2-reductase [Thermoanaerobaculia bacterium]|jgi:2-dehydropantoate 2-reductase
MRIAIVGAGGVGGYFGGRLAQAGVDTTFIARGATLDALRTRGLRVDSVKGDFVLQRVNATGNPSIVGPVDAILLAVKAWQLADAAKNLGPMLGPDTMVVPLENGIDAPDVLTPIVGREHVLGGLCAIVSFIVEPGHIRHAAFDPIVMFGELDNTRTARVERLRDAFTRAGVNAQIPDDIHHSMWTKLLFIAVMSGIGALTRVPVDVWRGSPEIRDIALAALREIVAVAAARGVDLGADAVEKTWQRYEGMAPGSTASLQRDVMDGKPSELDAQLGAIVRLARESGVDAPVLSLIYHALVPQERIARGVSGGR